jgi:hypothetical protein
MSEVNTMKEELNVYHAYLLRLRLTEYKGQGQWRASLESPHTGERQSFADLEQCFAFLRDLCSSQASGMLQAGKELKHEKSEAE